MSNMHVQSDKNRKELTQIFSYVRELILDREQSLKKLLSDNMIREEQECKNRVELNSELINKINCLKQELADQG